MNNTIIKVDFISKLFHIYKNPIDRLLENFIRKKNGKYKEFHALKNINFEVSRGESIALVGANGAGKSTLLQIICGTLTPTLGNVTVNGRISALLELGSGFNPEFSGRENIYFFGALQGMKKKEIDSRLDEILDFADIGDFIEQPVKTYSSGMYVRLAFASAIHVDPDILIVDEALAVGDEAFQNKCYSKINALRQSGVTVLFVTHSPQTVMSLCERALFFEHGELLLDGNPKDVISCYQKILYAPEDKRNTLIQLLRDKGVNAFKNNPQSHISEQQKVVCEDGEYFDPSLRAEPIAYEHKGLMITDPYISLDDGTRVNVLVRNKVYRYCYSVQVLETVRNIRFSMVIKTLNGTELGGFISAHSPYSGLEVLQKGEVYEVEFKFKTCLNSGVYVMNSGVRGTLYQDEEFLSRMLDAFMFRILPIEEQKETCFIDFGVECSYQQSITEI
ncbi:ABC transporter ATP-binding protein [Vibrio rhizosphaerae]|uniref:ABC transporter ATP-binding protein n=1 Tax=Vibrio rhizosphaerae TaxID=398736 RepID=UPI00056DFE07|nr:ABC transporter ATP-binding protein [Vibrio rhizosphaerae]